MEISFWVWWSDSDSCKLHDVLHHNFDGEIVIYSDTILITLELINLEAPSLHGNSVQNETKSPQLKICDYSTGAITEHAMLKLKIEKSKLESKNLNFSVENGAIKMDKKTQNQYYNSFVKIQVLSLSHRCKVRFWTMPQVKRSHAKLWTTQQLLFIRFIYQ